jgi:hypothetical protein
MPTVNVAMTRPAVNQAPVSRAVVRRAVPNPAPLRPDRPASLRRRPALPRHPTLPRHPSLPRPASVPYLSAVRRTARSPRQPRTYPSTHLRT